MSEYSPYESDQGQNGAKFFQNCCSKGYRAFAPYTSNWPYNAVFPPNDRRMDEWQSCFDPQCYQRRNFVCWRGKYNQGCVDTAPNSTTSGYWRQIQNRLPIGQSAQYQDFSLPPQFRNQPDSFQRGPPLSHGQQLSWPNQTATNVVSMRYSSGAQLFNAEI
jgi:hypothetical protein